MEQVISEQTQQSQNPKPFDQSNVPIPVNIESQMETAKIVSFISVIISICYCGLFFIFWFSKLYSTYSELRIGVFNLIPFYLEVLLAAILPILNSAYSFYL